MSQVITNAFENYWQSCLTAEQPVVLDEFILADIPNLDITSPIDPETGLPPESQIVHRQNVDQRGRINNNAVAYTIVMDTTVGDFSFNAMYLRNKQNGVIGMIVYKGRETKLKTDQTTGQTGNSLVKSMLMGYDQAAEATLTNVDAGTWQIDYAARLRGMDEDIRQLQADLYGHHTFVGDGFKVVEKDGAYQVSQGVAIVGGLRVELKAPEVINPGTKPIGVWVDVHRAGSLLSEHQNHVTIITSVADLADHVDSNGYQHYVAKLGTVQADSTIEDGRGSAGGGNGGAGSIPDTFAIWKRSMAEAGYDLIGQFGTKMTIETADQVVLSKDGKNVFAWLGSLPKNIDAEISVDEEGNGWVSRSDSVAAMSLRKSIEEACRQLGFNLVRGSFEKGGELTGTMDALLYEHDGTIYHHAAGPIKVAAGSVPGEGWKEISGFSVFACSIQEIKSFFDAGVRHVKTRVDFVDEGISVPKDCTLEFLGVVELALDGSVFELVTGSRVFGDFVIKQGFNPVVAHVNGRYRPTMLLADNRMAGIYGEIRSESGLPAGKAVYLDARALDGKRGIISWFECDISIRNLMYGCDAEASNLGGVDGGKSYINNNKIKIAAWDVPYCYIERDILGAAEIAANTVDIDYQCSTVSVQPLRIRGSRNRVTGNVWDADKSYYTSLLSNAIDIGGSSNHVGGRNWPSRGSGVVSITDSLVDYSGSTYGINRRDVRNLFVMGRGAVDHGGDVLGSIPAVLGFLSSPVDVLAGAEAKYVYSRSYELKPERIPYFVDGYVILTNKNNVAVTCNVQMGLKVDHYARSSKITVPAERSVRVELSAVIYSREQFVNCGDGSWYGFIDYSGVLSHSIHVGVSSLEGIQVSAIVMRRSGNV
ncbi:MAG: phage tail protein [Aeromonas veronii]